MASHLNAFGIYHSEVWQVCQSPLAVLMNGRLRELLERENISEEHIQALSDLGVTQVSDLYELPDILDFDGYALDPNEHRLWEALQPLIERNSYGTESISYAIHKIKAALAFCNMDELSDVILTKLQEAHPSDFDTAGGVYALVKTTFRDPVFHERLGLTRIQANKLKKAANYLLADIPAHFRSKRILDPVHGLIDVDGWLARDWLDTKPVQRLRELKQLGACSFVFPAARHTRFEHSLGVAH